MIEILLGVICVLLGLCLVAGYLAASSMMDAMLEALHAMNDAINELRKR